MGHSPLDASKWDQILMPTVAVQGSLRGWLYRSVRHKTTSHEHGARFAWVVNGIGRSAINPGCHRASRRARRLRSGAVPRAFPESCAARFIRSIASRRMQDRLAVCRSPSSQRRAATGGRFYGWFPPGGPRGALPASGDLTGETCAPPGVGCPGPSWRTSAGVGRTARREPAGPATTARESRPDRRSTDDRSLRPAWRDRC
jgi:hypothetical protein